MNHHWQAVDVNRGFRDNNFKEKVRDANPIVEVFKDLFPGNYKNDRSNAICPFHNDDNASLSFLPVHDRGSAKSFNCFGCGQKGDVFKLVELARATDFKGAVEYLASRRGMSSALAIKPHEIPEQVYTYYDSSGKYLYEKRRYPGKKFVIYSKDADGKDIKGKGKSKSILYNAWQVFSNPLEDPVIYTEGEKDAEALKSIGFCATTCGGVNLWSQVVTSKSHLILQDRIVWIVGDNDKAGIKHQMDVANTLARVSKEVKILKLPMKPSKSSKDFSDFCSIRIGEGKTLEQIKDEIIELAQKSPVFTVEEQTTDTVFNLKNKREFEASEWINALLDKHRMIYHAGRFHVYKDGRYETIFDTDVKIGVMLERLGGPELSKHNIQQIIYKLAIRLDNIQDRKKLVVNDPWILNLSNGWVDLRDENYTFKPHTPDLLTTFKSEISLNLQARCPKFDEFLDQQFPGLQNLIWEMLGYLLIPSTKYQVAFLIKGPGETGKSTLADIIGLLLGGKERCSNISINKLGHRFYLTELEGKLANITVETEVKSDVVDSVLKSVISGDPVDVEKKFADVRSMIPTARLVVVTNAFLRTADTSHAFFRRWIVIPAIVQIPKKKIRDYSKRLFEEEKEGILLKALAGLIRLKKQDGFTEVESSLKMRREWEETVDLVKYWASRNIVSSRDEMIKWADMAPHCNDFLRSEGYRSSFSSREFNDRMRNMGFRQTRKTDTQYLMGYRFATPSEVDLSGTM
ncbi:MAG: phage/plasmid primase, P4 family [Syntrophaceae bacterium]|nr:phage/plasmid primase, P4 family [Syntrophaceae bacterium]